MTATVPTGTADLSVAVDPRDPVLRLQAFADPDSVELLTEPDGSVYGVLVATDVEAAFVRHR